MSKESPTESPFAGLPENGEIRKCPYGPGRQRYSRSTETSTAYPWGWFHIDPCEHDIDYKKLIRDSATYLLSLENS